MRIYSFTDSLLWVFCMLVQHQIGNLIQFSELHKHGHAAQPNLNMYPVILICGIINLIVCDMSLFYIADKE